MGINFGRCAPYLCITGIGWTLLPAAVPVRTLPTASPKYRGAGWRATTFERPRSTIVIVVGAAGGGAAEFMYFLDNNFVGDASLLHYRPQITAGTRPAVVLIYDPYSYAIKRDLYGATITFTPLVLESLVYFTDDSFTVALLRQRERKGGSVCVRVIAVALLGIICTRGHITAFLLERRR